MGAGFSLDANAHLARENRRFSTGYPLVNALAAACFDSAYDVSGGVEPAFEQALQRRDPEPVRRLVHLIQAADYYAGSEVARLSDSPYLALIERFPEPTFLSFNYDGLLELILHAKRLWTPVDGFGLPCRADIDRRYIKADRPPEKSVVRVLHLHGSVYLYPIEFEFYEPYERRPSNTQWLRLTDKEEVQFDPDALLDCFIPFAGGAQGRPTYQLPSERIVVPSPDKASALADRFSKVVYAQAVAAVRSAETCIAIGYRFAECDLASFSSLLMAIDGGPTQALGIVAPDALDIATRIRPHLRQTRISTFEGTFGEWAASDFDLR